MKTHVADALLHEGVQPNFLVMEYVAGQTLRDLLDERQRAPEELGRHIGREVAKGLAAIHAAGVVHCDLKPENVLITADHVVKVMGLGVARLQDEAIRLSQAGAFVGALEYAAPEQFRASDGTPAPFALPQDGEPSGLPPVPASSCPAPGSRPCGAPATSAQGSS